MTSDTLCALKPSAPPSLQVAILLAALEVFPRTTPIARIEGSQEVLGFFQPATVAQLMILLEESTEISDNPHLGQEQICIFRFYDKNRALAAVALSGGVRLSDEINFRHVLDRSLPNGVAVSDPYLSSSDFDLAPDPDVICMRQGLTDVSVTIVKLPIRAPGACRHEDTLSDFLPPFPTREACVTHMARKVASAQPILLSYEVA